MKEEKNFGYKEAAQRLYRLLARREYSAAEAKEKLLHDGFSEETAEEAVAKAVEGNVISDARYAEALVRTRLAAGKGRRGIERELAQKGIAPELISEWGQSPGDDEGQELERALEVLCKRPPRSKNPRDAGYRKLISKGYSSPIASTAVRLWCEGEQVSG